MRIAYARVSTDDQSLDLQLDALSQAVCERVFTDKASAAKNIRPGLTEALSYLREGDVLATWKLDRLGRTVKGLVDFVGELAEQKVHFRSLTDGIDTTTPTGRFFFHVIASMAQIEHELVAERTKAGLDAARQRGRLVGRKRSMTPGKIESAKQLLSTGMPPREVAQNLSVSVPTLYRWVSASSRLWISAANTYLNATTYCKSIVQPGAKPYVAFRAFVGIGKIMDLNQVRYFLAVANTLNFTRAAKQCYVSQQAFTQAIRRLQAEVGGELIHRDGRYTMLS